ncbi:MAG: hypothetical protein LC659_04225 [Myxococcales bacterium]|nr:hypothetical protein [Myxococcales bacterium]
MGDDEELLRRSEAYIDGIFGSGAGEKHSRFLQHIENPTLRATIHSYHLMQAQKDELSIEENYLIGMCVVAAQRCYGPAGMFAKTLRHRGVRREKILEAAGRLSMWIGGIVAAEASAHIQKALDDYDKRGVASLDAWFPDGKR